MSGDEGYPRSYELPDDIRGAFLALFVDQAVVFSYKRLDIELSTVTLSPAAIFIETLPKRDHFKFVTFVEGDDEYGHALALGPLQEGPDNLNQMTIIYYKADMVLGEPSKDPVVFDLSIPRYGEIETGEFLIAPDPPIPEISDEVAIRKLLGVINMAADAPDTFELDTEVVDYVNKQHRETLEKIGFGAREKEVLTIKLSEALQDEKRLIEADPNLWGEKPLLVFGDDTHVIIASDTNSVMVFDRNSKRTVNLRVDYESDVAEALAEQHEPRTYPTEHRDFSDQDAVVSASTEQVAWLRQLLHYDWLEPTERRRLLLEVEQAQLEQSSELMETDFYNEDEPQ